MITLIVSTLLSSLSFLSNLENEMIVYNDLSISEAKLASTQNEKNILVIYSAEWCLPCQLLDDKVLSNEGVTKILANDFVTIKADYDNIENQEWFIGYSVKRLPTMSVVNNLGSELDRFEGSADYSEFKNWLLKHVKQKRKTLRVVSAQFSSPPIVKVPTEKTLNKSKFSVIQFGAFSNENNAKVHQEKVQSILNRSIDIHIGDNGLFKVLLIEELDDSQLESITRKAKESKLNYFIKY